MASETVILLKEAKDVGSVGGKAKALGELIRAGFNVPDGFVITTASGTTVTDELTDEIMKFFDGLGVKYVAVRSSAVAEDGSNNAWAGQMDTFLNIDQDHLLDAVKKCWASANSVRAKAYAKQKNLTVGRVAVLVQAMIQGDASGVAFSVHPVTQNPKHMIIEAVAGLTDSLVSGEATPNSYVIDKRNGKTIESHPQAGSKLLSDKQLTEVAKIIGQLEKHFRFPIDVEWTFADNKLFILQSRPITTLG